MKYAILYNIDPTLNFGVYEMEYVCSIDFYGPENVSITHQVIHALDMLSIDLYDFLILNERCSLFDFIQVYLQFVLFFTLPSN